MLPTMSAGCPVYCIFIFYYFYMYITCTIHVQEVMTMGKVLLKTIIKRKEQCAGVRLSAITLLMFDGA